MKPYLFSLILGIGLLLPVADARTWTSSDGAKTFKAELQSYDEESGIVVVQKINGKKLTFKLSILSEQDIEYIKTEGVKQVGDCYGLASHITVYPAIHPMALSSLTFFVVFPMTTASSTS